MSAFIVDPIHIDALVTAGLEFSRPYGLHWYDVDPDELDHDDVADHHHELTYETAGRTAVMLYAENCASVLYRYPQDTIQSAPGLIDKPTPDEYEFRKLPGTPKPVDVLSALACYEYQSCEHPGWKTSEAKRFCDALRAACIRRLPGYENAPWEIVDRDIFRYRTKAATR